MNNWEIWQHINMACGVSKQTKHLGFLTEKQSLVKHVHTLHFFYVRSSTFLAYRVILLGVYIEVHY